MTANQEKNLLKSIELNEWRQVADFPAMKEKLMLHANLSERKLEKAKKVFAVR